MKIFRILLMSSTMLIAWAPPASADPLTIGVSILVNIGYGGAISGLGATLLGSAVLGAAAFGLSLVSNALFKPPAPQRSQQERQATLRQSVGARVRFYGRVKTGGTLWFFEVKSGDLYTGMTLNEGQISAIIETWLNDKRVTVSSDGRVITEPYVYRANVEGNPLRYPVKIYYKNGASDQTVHSVLDAAFTQVTTAHRLRGVANVLAIFDEVPQRKITEVYPQFNPSVRVVMDSSLVKSVRTGGKIFSSNPADCIYDYLTANDDAGFPYGAGFLESQIDLPSFQAFADLCDEIVPTKAPGTIKRYALAGGYGLDEEMRSVLPRMLATCDGDLYLTKNGKIAIRGGKWKEPQLTLDSDRGHIINAEFSRGPGALAAFNELTIKYTEPGLDYQETEADRWIDSSNIALIGKVRTEQLELPMVSNHPQARRLGKIFTHRNNPRWTGRIDTNFYGLNAINEDTVRIIYSPLLIDETFAVKRVQIKPDMTGAIIEVASLSATAYAWDAVLEEGNAPGQPVDTGDDTDLPPPDDFNVSVARKTISGETAGVFLAVTWTEPDREALGQEVEYRLLPEGPWVPMTVSDGSGYAESGILQEGSDYEVRIRTNAPSGTPGDWSESVIVTATANITAPAPVTDAVVTPNASEPIFSWTNSASANSVATRIYRNTVNDSVTASLIATVYGSPSVPTNYIASVTAPGTYYYWLGSLNGSGVMGTLVATPPQVIT